MRVVGVLVFALSAIVHSIVCPGFPAGYFPRDESIPSDYRTLVVTPEEYPDAHVRNSANGSLHLMQMPFGAFVRRDTIVASNFNGRVRPIYNSEGHLTIRNMETRTTEIITLERAQEIGLMSYLSTRVRVRDRARASAQAQARMDRPNGTSG